MKYLQYFVFLVIVIIGLFDMTTGLYLLFSNEPYLVNGSSTLWLELKAIYSSDSMAGLAVKSLFKRIGAFSFFAGFTTLIWAFVGLRNSKIISTLLISYMIAGLFFFYTDNIFFKDTNYLIMKQVIGTFWFAAFLCQLYINKKSN